MIDLSYKPKKEKEEKKECPLIVEIIVLLPFAFLLWLVLTTSFINGIF